MNKYKVFDTHVHIFPDKVAHKAVANLGQYYQVAMAEEGTWDSFQAAVDEAGCIEKCLIHSTATRPGQVQNVNNFVASKINDRLLGFGSIHPDYEDIEEEIDRIISLGLRGIKLHPDFQLFNVDSEKACRIYAYAEDKLPILFHVGDKNVDYSSPLRIRRIADKFPRLKIIAAHLGGYSAWDDAEKYLVGQNVYFDTSSSIQFMSFDRAVNIIRTHGVDKCLFGTDFPMHNPKKVLERFFALGLTEEENRKILWDNAAALFL